MTLIDFILGTWAGGFITAFVVPIVMLQLAGSPPHRAYASGAALRVAAVVAPLVVAVLLGNHGAWLACGVAALWAIAQHIGRRGPAQHKYSIDA